MAMYGGYLFRIRESRRVSPGNVYFGMFWINEFHGNVDDGDPLIRWSLNFDEVPIYI